jgi:folate-binding protein YgfZ
MDGYQAVRTAVGLLDRSDRGFIQVTGRDALPWLQGMVSNDVRPLGGDVSRIQACVLNSSGHLLADIALIATPAGILMEMERFRADQIMRVLESYIISEDVELRDLTGDWACLSLQGPGADALASASERGVTCVPADHTGSGGFDLYLSARDAAALKQRLLSQGAVPVDEVSEQVLRVEAGIPLDGADMDERTIPLEAGLGATHISEKKGCYIGQEIIARISARGHTNREWTGLLLGNAPLPDKGAQAHPPDDLEREAGWVTSAAWSPHLGQGIALGYVRHEHREPGTILKLHMTDGVETATVAELPFYTIN